MWKVFVTSYSERHSSVSMEFLLPQGCKGFENLSDPHNLEASIIKGLCDTVKEEAVGGDKVKILLILKKQG